MELTFPPIFSLETPIRCTHTPSYSPTYPLALPLHHEKATYVEVSRRVGHLYAYTQTLG